MDSFLMKFFPSVYRKEEEDKSTNQYCKFDSQLLTAFTSSLYLAALISSFFASKVTKVFGRKWSMFGGGLTFLVGSALNGAAQNVLMLILGRILLGVGVGFANQVTPLTELKLCDQIEIPPYFQTIILEVVQHLSVVLEQAAKLIASKQIEY